MVFQSTMAALMHFSVLSLCLFNRSLHPETHLGLGGTRLEQNAQIRLKSLRDDKIQK